MDPNANLKEQLKMAQAILIDGPSGSDHSRRLAELVLALNEWITDGGFLPTAWQESRLCNICRGEHPTSDCTKMWSDATRPKGIGS